MRTNQEGEGKIETKAVLSADGDPKGEKEKQEQKYFISVSPCYLINAN